MPDYQITFTMVEQTNGWTETFYGNAGDITTLKSAMAPILVARAACLPRQVSFEGVRYSDQAVLGDSTLDASSYSLAKVALDRDISQLACLFRLESGMLYRRSFLMRGMPDGWIEYDTAAARMSREDLCRTATNNFFNAIVQAQLRLKVISKDPTVVQASTVSAIAAGPATGTSQLTIAPGFASQPGDKIRISKMKNNLKILNGVWRNFAMPNNTTVVLPVSFTALTGFLPTDFAQATVKLQRYIYVPINNYVFMDVRARQTGRPIFVPAGRRKRAPISR